MNIPAARLGAALLAACAATTPAFTWASEILQNPGGEALADEQSAFLRVTFEEDPYGLAFYEETELQAVGTSAGQWTEVDDMRVRRSPTGHTILRVPGDDLVVRLAPGSYQLRAACHGDEEEHQIDAHPLEVAAGREYVAECRGLPGSAARLRIADQPVRVLDVVRPVRVGLIDLPAGSEPARVGEAIKAAMAHRGWDILNEEPGRIDAIHHDVKSTASIRVQYDSQEASFTFLDGKDIKVRVFRDKNGEMPLRFFYYYWIRFLGQDIGKQLAGEPLTD
jgi:hypothetical protein